MNRFKEENIKRFLMGGLIAFSLGFFAMILMLVFSGRLGGKYEVLNADGFKLVANIRMFARNLLHGESIWYSFSTSMGMNTSLLVACNFFSPFNILYILFYNADPNVITALVFALKTGTAAVSFYYFSTKTLSVKDSVAIFFGMLYSMCAFNIFTGVCNNMFADALYVLPIVAYGIYLGVKENKFMLLTVAYAYSFITEFYTGYIIATFSFLLFFLLLFLGETKLEKKEVFIRIRTYTIAVIVAVLLSAFAWMPALYCILHYSANDATGFTEIRVTFLDIINQFLWGRRNDVYSIYPLLYCGVPTLLLFPFGLINKKISIRKRLIIGIVLAFGILCMLFKPLYMLIHAFDAPDGFDFRFSFVISFILCILASWGVQTVKEKKLIWIVSYIIGLSALMFFFFRLAMQGYGRAYEFNYITPIFVNLLLLICWLAVVVIYRRVEITKKWTIVVLFAVGFIEIVSNGVFQWDYNYIDITTKSAYSIWSTDMHEMEDDLKKDSSFYRVLFQNDFMDNSDSFWGYNGITDFDTSENPVLRDTLHKMGLFTSPRMIHPTGITPVSEMLLGVKYRYVGTNPYDTDGGVSLVQKTENPYYISVGFMVEDSVLGKDYENENAFENLNVILHDMTGTEDNAFVPIYSDGIILQTNGLNVGDAGDLLAIYLEEGYSEGSMFLVADTKNNQKAYFQAEYPQAGNYRNNVYLEGIQNAMYVSSIDTDQTITGGFIAEMIRLEEGYGIAIQCTDGTYLPMAFNRFNLYSLDEEALENICLDLKNEQFVVSEYKNGYLKGTVNVESNRRLLYTSIPYIDGWTVTINGMKTTPVPVLNGAFIGIQIPDTGLYEIEMKYHCPYVREGVLVSVGAVVLLLSIIILRKSGKNSKK